MSSPSPALAVVTGATSGLGIPLAAGLARAGWSVLIGARDPARAEGAVRRVRDAAGAGADVRWAPLDLASLASVRSFAAAVGDGQGVGRLVLNAGVMAMTRRTTAEGLELMLGTNLVGHAALVHELQDRLLATPGARVVVQSSEAHRQGRLDPADPLSEQGFKPVAAYSASKLAQHVHAVELDRRTALEVVVAQPGWVVSGLGRELAGGGRGARVAHALGNRLIGQTPAEGARAALRAALEPVTPSASTGRYWTPGRLHRLRGEPVLGDAEPIVLDRELGAGLWSAVQRLITGHHAFTAPSPSRP